MSYPNKEQRSKCYTARDGLWNCLDVNEDNKDKCLDFRKQFENFCPQQWVCIPNSFQMSDQTIVLSSNRSHILTENESIWNIRIRSKTKDMNQSMKQKISFLTQTNICYHLVFIPLLNKIQFMWQIISIQSTIHFEPQIKLWSQLMKNILDFRLFPFLSFHHWFKQKFD